MHPAPKLYMNNCFSASPWYNLELSDHDIRSGRNDIRRLLFQVLWRNRPSRLEPHDVALNKFSIRHKILSKEQYIIFDLGEPRRPEPSKRGPTLEVNSPSLHHHPQWKGCLGHITMRWGNDPIIEMHENSYLYPVEQVFLSKPCE